MSLSKSMLILFSCRTRPVNTWFCGTRTDCSYFSSRRFESRLVMTGGVSRKGFFSFPLSSLLRRSVSSTFIGPTGSQTRGLVSLVPFCAPFSVSSPICECPPSTLMTGSVGSTSRAVEYTVPFCGGVCCSTDDVDFSQAGFKKTEVCPSADDEAVD